MGEFVLNPMEKGYFKLDIYVQNSLEEFFNKEVLCSEEDCKTCKCNFICNYNIPNKPLENTTAKKMTSIRFSNEQMDIIGVTEGYKRVIAGAGSGKTLTMVARIGYLLENDCNENEILVFSFTNTAAKELQKRIKIYCDDNEIDYEGTLRIQTFHGFCNEMLSEPSLYEKFGYTKKPKPILKRQKKMFIYELLKEEPEIPDFSKEYENLKMNFPNCKGAIPVLDSMFSYIKENELSMYNPDDMDKLRLEFRYEEPTLMAIMNMYNKYQQKLVESNLLEFADLELNIKKIMEEDPYYFDKLGIKHVIIDEAQDTSVLQHRITKKLIDSPVFKSLMIVGDDSQSIYAFRNASVQSFIDISDFYNVTVEDMQLSTNYRSTPEIVNFSNEIINYNTKRTEKIAVSGRTSTNEPVEVLKFDSKDDEIESIIQNAAFEYLKGRQVAIIASKRSELQKFATILSERDIPSVMMSPEVKADNSRIKALIALFKFRLDHTDKHSGLVYLNAVDRNISEMSDDDIEKAIKALEKDMENKTMEDLASDIAPDGYDEIFDNFRNEVFENKSITAQQRVIDEFEEFGEDETDTKMGDYEGIILTTVHSSKGTEFEVVILTLSNFYSEGMNNDMVEEKRRLFYVGSTRAKDKLIITGRNIAKGSVKTKTAIYNPFISEAIAISIKNKI